MVATKNVIGFSIGSKEEFSAVVIKLLYIKKRHPNLPKAGTSEHDEMMFLYDLFNEYVERTGITDIELPYEYVCDLELPECA